MYAQSNRRKREEKKRKEEENGEREQHTFMYTTPTTFRIPDNPKVHKYNLLCLLGEFSNHGRELTVVVGPRPCGGRERESTCTIPEYVREYQLP